MAFLEIITLQRIARQPARFVGFASLLLSLLLLAATASGAAYYSTGAPISSSPTASCSLGVCGTGVATSVTTPVGTVTISATVYLPLAGTSKLRYQLNGTALAGYRGGLLLSPNSALLSLNAVGAITIRTYLSTGASPTVAQDQMVASASVVQAQLLSGKGAPVQMELLSTAPFDQVEVEFASALSLGTAINVHYAYGVGPNVSAQITGLTSNSSSATTTTPYSTSGCSDKISNPGQAADNDPTNYATFSSLASVNCNPLLDVGLNGTAPSTYKAGFVVGQDNNLLDVSVLSHLTLKTYLNGVLQETSNSGTSLLSLSVLPDNKSLINFQATKAFDAVSIERSDLATALDNLRLYYGVGVASTTPPQVISSFSNPNGHYTVSSNGTLCVGCTVTSPSSAAGDPNSAATVNVGIGVNNWSGLALDLNGTGLAGNRAGMVIGNNSLLDVAALSRMTLVTYDASGNVLETASGASLLKVNLLPDGRQTVSFNTTKDFAKVGIQIGGLVSAVSNTSVYYAFSDSSNGSITIVPPTVLPVTLTSFGVRRLAGSGIAELSWTTASEVNSDHFVVERSATPETGFQSVGQVTAAGSSTTVRQYSLRDAGAATQTSILYYRLRQVDADGQQTLSAVVVLAASQPVASFSLYPNPVSAADGRVSISAGAAQAAGGSVSIYSGVGQLLSSQPVAASASDEVLTVPTANLSAGLYHVVLRNAAGLQLFSQRLLVTGR